MKESKNNKNKNYETELPHGYEQVYSINALDKKTGIIFNLIAFAVMVAVIVCALIPLRFDFGGIFAASGSTAMLACVVFIVAMMVYILLHELVHGAVYKIMTGQKLTFGLSWSCAYCGVPEVYTYRRTALAALAAPFVLFSIVFVLLTVYLYSENELLYFLSSLLFALHLGGCSGDIYMLWLLLTKFRAGTLLMRDTGAEQFLYLQKTE